MSDSEAQIKARESVLASNSNAAVDTVATLPRPDDSKAHKAKAALKSVARHFMKAIVPRIRRSALRESLAFFAVAIGLNLAFGDGARYIHTSPHPFWIIVLLISVQYGPIEALMTAALSSAFLLVGNLPEQSLSETMYEYVLRISQLPFLWVITALVLGTIRARQIEELANLKQGLVRASEVSSAIVTSYKSVKKSKEHLELRLAEERRSVLTMYEIARNLETLDPVEAAEGVQQLIKTALNPTKFSLYRWENNELRLQTSYGWTDQDRFTEKFDGEDQFMREGLSKNRILSVLRAEDEVLLDGQGMLAGPIYDERTQRLFGALKIEETGFTDMSIRSHETFRVVCAWIARVYANIETHQQVVANQEDFTSELVLLAQAASGQTPTTRRSKR